MIRTLFTFRPWDICLILFFILFIAAVVAGLLITGREKLAIAVRRRLIILTDRLEEFTRRMKDDTPYEPWMGYREWKETRR